MKFQLIDDKERWNKFIIENSGSFLQSFEWGEFKKQFSQKVRRIEVSSEDGRRILEAQVFKEKILFITYFYLPYGPIFNNHSLPKEKEESFALFLKKTEEWAKKEGVSFLRIEPIAHLPRIENFYVANAPKRDQPQRTLILDITKSEEDLLKSFHPKTRYNINLAKKKNVKIKKMNYEPKILDKFWTLLQNTAKKRGFRTHPKLYYQKMFEVPGVKFFVAFYQKEIIAVNISIFFAKTATYLHGAFDYQYRNLMAPYLLHWEQIKEAKRQGCQKYDFWGIDEKKYPGVTRFKKGFRGEEVEYLPAIDIVFDRTWYRIYRILRKIKQIF